MAFEGSSKLVGWGIENIQRYSFVIFMSSNRIWVARDSGDRVSAIEKLLN